MMFEAYRISEHNYQLFMVDNHRRLWLASFNKLDTLLDYYIYCHNLSFDSIRFTGTVFNEDEQSYFNQTIDEWNIQEGSV